MPKRPVSPATRWGCASASRRLASLAGASSPARGTARGVPLPFPSREPSRRITSATTSCTSAWFIDENLYSPQRRGGRRGKIWFSLCVLCASAVNHSSSRLVKRLPREHRRIDDADDHRIRGQVLRLVSHPRAAALHDEHELAFAGAD